MEKIKIKFQDINDIAYEMLDCGLIDEYFIEYEFDLMFKNNKFKVEYNFGSAYYDVYEMDDVVDNLDKEFDNFSLELEYAFNNFLEFLNDVVDIKSIELKGNVLEIISDKFATKELLKQIENNCEYVEEVESDNVNQIIALKQKNEELEREVKKLKRAMENCSNEKKQELYNVISGVYGFSMGIYDSKGNKVCDGYSPELPEKRIDSI